jgi:methionine synthase / methylenetetrahydrofolate reductase (NADH)
MSLLLERLEAGPPLVADGGLGALLSAAVPRLHCPEEASARAADAVVSLHVSFLNAGAELIRTNTFGANRRKLARFGLEDQVERINSEAVKQARRAREITARDAFIAGSLGPLGEPVASAERRTLFAEQAALLEGRGADLFMLETFDDLDELVDAVVAVQSVSTLPIVALLSFGESGRTAAGFTPVEAAAWLHGLGVAAIGANHGAGMVAALEALGQMRNGTPLAILPNLGLASMAGSRVVFPHATPEYFAEFGRYARELGARVIGGCCGTTPTEIAAIADALREERRPAVPRNGRDAELAVSLGERQLETGLARALREQEWVVSVQLDPPLGGSLGGLVETSRALAESGAVGFVDVNDNATARAGINSLMASAAIERETGLETIPHVTTRDWTVLGLESLLLGAHAEGVRNVLAITGDPPEIGERGRGVFEIDAIGLTRLVTQLNRGEDWNGSPIDAPTSFVAGVAVNPTADDPGLEADRFAQKVEAGAHFAMTQIVFDLDDLDRFCERLGGSWPIPVLVGIFPLTSYRLARRLHDEVPGIIVPESLQRELESAGSDAAAVGARRAARLIAEARDASRGVYVVAPYRRPLSVVDLL